MARMMNLTTPVDIPTDKLPRLSQAQRLLLMGSCFANEMGTRLQTAKFRCEVNPYGVLYNPNSIAAALREIREKKTYTETDLFQHNSLWHSPMHHGDFSTESTTETLQHINERITSAHETMQQMDVLLLTWGTAWVYEEKETGHIVGNCHKLPERNFTRRRLTVEEIVADYTQLLTNLRVSEPNLTISRPNLRVILTISPIRHLRDGLHENQLSKATLLLAADELQRRFPDLISYFPAYEILLDELRDYRFYADDLLHPSHLAVEYVWQRFAESCFTPEAQEIATACEEIQKMLAHRPFHPDSEEYKRFLGQIVLKIERLNGKYPYLALEKEKELCHIRLRTLQK